MGAVKNSGIGRMLRIDCGRAFLSGRFAVSVIMGVTVCYFAMLFCGYHSPAVHIFVYMHSKSIVFLALIAGVLPYSACFYADFLHGNIRNVLGRADMGQYVFSKSVAAVASSVAAFLLGKLIFVALYSARYPICPPQTMEALKDVILYEDIAAKGWYALFFLLASLQMALYCGVLCQVVMLVSIWIPNLSVMFSIPIGVFYVVTFHFRNIMNADFLNLTCIFDGVTRVWERDIWNFVYALFVAAALFLLLLRATIWAMRRKMYHV